ncbi:MAG: hypothetical protein NVSMB9_05530 [Isosphaeraceae bacterium]
MRTLRGLRTTCREFPSTMVLGTLWVVVFVLMAANQASRPEGLTFNGFLLGLRNGDVFGELTIRDLTEGKIWRTVTATFIHFGLIHLAMNLWALVQLGFVVESWYGSAPFLAIYVLTGGGGNLISVLIRRSLLSDPEIASGGGSTVIMGLVALCAIVGWRAGTQIGDYLRRQMVIVLVLTAGLGLGLSAAGLPVIDNWGHAGGALMGALLGLADGGLVRIAVGRIGRGSGWLGALIISASALAQVSSHARDVERQRHTLEEASLRQRHDARGILSLQEIRRNYRIVVEPLAVKRGSILRELPRPSSVSQQGPASVPPPLPAEAPKSDPDPKRYRTILTATLRSLDALRPVLDAGASASDYQRSRQILVQSLIEPPTQEEMREFDERIRAMLDRLGRSLEGGRSVTETRRTSGARLGYGRDVQDGSEAPRQSR